MLAVAELKRLFFAAMNVKADQWSLLPVDFPMLLISLPSGYRIFLFCFAERAQIFNLHRHFDGRMDQLQRHAVVVQVKRSTQDWMPRQQALQRRPQSLFVKGRANMETCVVMIKRRVAIEFAVEEHSTLKH